MSRSILVKSTIDAALGRALLAGLLALVASCGDGGDEGGELPLQFSVGYGDRAVRCGSALQGVGVGDHTATITDLRWFAHAFELRDGAGTWRPAPLLDRGPWQSAAVGLLDFEDGTGPCNAGTAGTNDTLVVDAPGGAVTGVRFRIGVPFELNHIDVVTAPAPLDVPSLWWVWRAGYIFFRLDLDDGAAPFFAHLGSSGCESAAPIEPPDAPCARSNRVTIELAEFDPATQTIHLDLQALLEGVDLGSNVPDSPPGCMSAPSEPEDCEPIFEALGMSFQTGACVDGCRAQRVFSAR